jgi:hypothetical protein
MVHFLNSLLLVGACVFIFAMVHAAKVLLRNHRAQAAPFRSYFTTEYDSELLRHSALSEDEDWIADRHSRAISPLPCDAGEHE